MRRLQLKNETLELINLNLSSPRYPTVIEDLLDPHIFFEAITTIVSRSGDTELIELISNLQVNSDCKYTGFSNDLNSIEGKDMDSHKRKQEIINFISRHEIKYELAIECAKIYESSTGRDEPEWIQTILNLFDIN